MARSPDLATRADRSSPFPAPRRLAIGDLRSLNHGGVGRRRRTRRRRCSALRSCSGTGRRRATLSSCGLFQRQWERGAGLSHRHRDRGRPLLPILAGGLLGRSVLGGGRLRVFPEWGDQLGVPRLVGRFESAGDIQALRRPGLWLRGGRRPGRELRAVASLAASL